MEKYKRFSLIFTGTIIYLSIFLYGEHYRVLLRIVTGRTFRPLPLYIFYVTFPMIIGLLLAVPHLLIETKKAGRWKYDWVKFLAIQIPAIYLILPAPLIFIYPPLRDILYPRFINTLLTQSSVMNVVGIVVGYFSLSLLYKDDESTETNV